MIYINTILLISIIYLLWTIKNIRVNKVVDDIKKTNYIVKKAKGKPTYADVDPSYQVLTDIIDSIELENWKVNVSERASLLMKIYDLKFQNADNSIELQSILVLSEETGSIDVRRTYIKCASSKVINIEGDVTNILREFLWEKVLEYESNMWEKSTSEMKDTLFGISKKLKTLNRDRHLKKLI